MNCKANLELTRSLPFATCSPFFLSQLFQSDKNEVIEKLKANNFSKNMIKHVNGFSKNNYTCNYYNKKSIQNLSRKHLPNNIKNFHLNIESFSSNKAELSVFFKCLQISFDIICLTEVRHTNIGLIDMEFPDFNIFLDNAPSSKGAKGGVALLLKKDKFDQVTELDFNANFNLKNTCTDNKCQTENKWVSFKINNQKVIIGCIYRHPKGNIDHFTSALKNTISHINDNTLAIILGDINIDLMQESDAKVNTYINNFFEHNFIPCITLPTRITHHSATLLDHIFIKSPKKLIQNKCSSGNFIADLSDHLPNFTFLDIETQSVKDRPFTRIFSKNKIDKFNESLISEPSLISPTDLTDTNSSYDIFSTNYQNLFDKYFPYVRMSKKTFKDKPYITSGIKVSLKTKYRLYEKYLNKPNDVNKAAWKRFRNKTSEIIKRAEEMYYKKMINSHNNSSKILWKTFGKILNDKKVKHNKLVNLNIDGQNVSNPQAISDSVNKFFSEIGENLANKFSQNDNSEYKKYLGNPIQQSMFLHDISKAEITDAICDLKNSNSTGYDDFTTKFVKLSTPILVPALEKIFNLSIQTGIYPNSLKMAKVIPIFKKGDPNSVNNYRPISILSPINKIFEKIIYSRLINYIEKNQLLYKYQYGFRKNHSTEHALIELVDQIRLNMGERRMTCGIFIDLSKAFDTVNHHILLAKLENYGIRGKALDLLKSYLTERKQYVLTGNCKSQIRSVSCGVPQGSVLGPLLFLMFINDLPNSCPLGKVRIFADDTSIFFHSDNIEDIILTTRNIMTQLTSWFDANKLTLNADKSSFTIFRSAKKIIPNIPDHIEFQGKRLMRTPHIKFLGIFLEENLNWTLQINEICNKLKRLFHIFYNIRNFLSNDNIKTIYYTLIYSRIKYGISLYSQAGSSKLKRIQTLQNCLLKVLTRNSKRFSTNELHNSLDLLKVDDIATQEIVTFVYNYFSNSLPPVFEGYFETLASQHGRNTRNGNKLIKIIDHKTDIAGLSTKILGAKLWNKLDNSLKTIPNVKAFKAKFKKHILKY